MTDRDRRATRPACRRPASARAHSPASPLAGGRRARPAAGETQSPPSSNRDLLLSQRPRAPTSSPASSRHRAPSPSRRTVPAAGGSDARRGRGSAAAGRGGVGGGPAGDAAPVNWPAAGADRQGRPLRLCAPDARRTPSGASHAAGVARRHALSNRACALELVYSCEAEETIGHSFMCRTEEGHEDVCASLVGDDGKSR